MQQLQYPSNPPMTVPQLSIADLLHYATQQFAACGIESARLDAELLLAHVLGTDRLHLYREPQQTLTQEQYAHFYELVNRREQREPIAYIIGEKEFWSLPIAVDRHVLIPRPETELLVETALSRVKPLDDQGCRVRILELGTGSGAVAIALAKETTHAVIIAADRSIAALRVAQKNILRHGYSRRVHLMCGDWLCPCAEKPLFYMIVVNPPYIPTCEIDTLAPEIKNYEPRVALDGGADGLDFYRSWIPVLPRLLLPGGWVIVEMGQGQASRIIEMYRQSHHYAKLSTIKDYASCERILIAQLR
ncbi:MAG: peptide chain release factor N(5)-glutamine methyltransferase [Desulfobacterota bacterium]|nr:peptide chain release factor N(5)-glutamine methyltransferase [Thermodesulfobacteriota bacterium]